MGSSKFMGKVTKCAALALVFGVVGGTAFSGSRRLIGKLHRQSIRAFYHMIIRRNIQIL